MGGYYDGFKNRAEVESAFHCDIDDEVEILVAVRNKKNIPNNAFVLFRLNYAFYEVNAYADVNGSFAERWDVEPSSTQEILRRLVGDGDNGLFGKTLKGMTGRKMASLKAAVGSLVN